MILEFSVTNFYSFKKKVTFSMIANMTNGLNDNYVVVGNNKVLKTSAIYGANASGKSNLLKILNTVILMLRNSNNNDINAKLPIVPFKFDKKTINNPSEFEIKFLMDNIRYVYGFIADMKQIYEEYLYYYPNGRETKIFDRTNINNYSFPQKEEKKLKDIEYKNATNKFILATATTWNYEKSRPAYKFLTSEIGVFFNIEDLKRTAFNIYENEEKKLKEFALNLLRKTDFNIEDYKVTKINISTNILNQSDVYQVLFKHKGLNNYLTLDEESLGTEMIFSFIPFIAHSLNKQKVLVIDELDKSLHPFLVHYIVEIFNNSEINKAGSQLIFNTHDTNLLDLNILRRDQIWFTEKNSDNGESDLYSLSDFSVRKKENIEKGYMLGRYGAVPFIKNDLNIWEEN